MVGNFLGDFVKGRAKGFNEKILRGIELHRKIDSFTDSHPIVRDCKKFISPARAKYAGVLTDVFFDYFLAKHWARYTDQTLSEFAEFAYKSLQNHQGILPENVQNSLPRMIAGDFLTAYRQLDYLEFVLQRIAVRVRRENEIAGGVKDLRANYEKFDVCFQQFFPDVIEFADNYRFAGTRTLVR